MDRTEKNTDFLSLFRHKQICSKKILTARKSKKHQHVNEEELDNIDDHSSQGDLQRPQVGVYGEDVHQLEEREDHAGCKGTFGKQHRVE